MMGKNFGQARFKMLFQDLREDMKEKHRFVIVWLYKAKRKSEETFSDGCSNEEQSGSRGQCEGRRQGAQVKRTFEKIFIL